MRFQWLSTMSISHHTDVAFDPDVAGELASTQKPWRTATRAIAPIDVTLRVHRDLSTVADDWRQLEAEGACTVFQTYLWCSAWMRHIGVREGTRPAIVAGHDRDGEILFLLPLAVERRGGVRRLTWLGTDLCDYNAPLLARDFAKRVGPDRFLAVWQEIRGLLAADADLRFDIIALDKMSATVGDQPNPFFSLRTALHPCGAYLTHLGADWESFYRDRRSSATRRRDRVKLKRMAAIGPVEFVTPEDKEGIVEALTELFEHKGKSFARMGVADMFARPGWRDFFIDVATRATADGLAHVSRLDVGPTIAATNFGLIFRGRYHHILASYRDGEVARFGPGAAHLRELMRYAIERGCSEFDFTIGDESYKREWADTELILYDYRAAATARGFIALLAAISGRRLKRMIKQTPVLWNAFSKGRARAGALFRGKAADGPPADDDDL
jgi:CelD/BcsL family acetyltransferase involved in cellulose biosynthesis